jgi:23S rRNA pseudouridine2605 synthase
VKVNGKTGQLNDEVSDRDRVELDGKPLQSQKPRYILIHKPDRTVTTLKDTENRPTTVDLIDIPERVVPIGLLDFDTTGALLLTNDGELAHKLMHPSFEVNKVYEAEVQGVITPEIPNMLSIGIELEDGKTAPAKANKLSDNKIELTIHEGRNHQVKRMLDAVGLPVRRLHRSKYGSLDLTGLRPGQWRDLTPDEIAQLKG